jgi:AcrR family transcriptional regulator
MAVFFGLHFAYRIQTQPSALSLSDFPDIICSPWEDGSAVSGFPGFKTRDSMRSKIATRIVDAAVQAFAETGYYGTSTKEIALAADVTEGSLFRLFQSKENLFKETLKRVASTQMTPEQFAELLSREGDFREVVQAAIRRWYQSVTPDYARLAMHANLSTPNLAREIIYTRVPAFNQALADAIDRHKGRRRGGKLSKVCAQNFMFGVFYYRLTRAVLNHRAKQTLSEREYLQTALECFFLAVDSSR